jgi:hypothetical protein
MTRAGAARRAHVSGTKYRPGSQPRSAGSGGRALNAENLLDARQTRFDPLVLPARAPEGRWTTDAWAPLEGRTFNAGVRLEF